MNITEECFFLPNPVFDKVQLRYTSNLITSILNGIFSPIAVIGNFAILFIIWKATWLRDPASLLLGCLAICDMLVGFVVQPSYVSFRLSENRDGYVPCVVRMMYSTSFYICYGVSFMTLNAISYERYIALALHLRYQAIVTKHRILLLAAAIWIVNIILTCLQWSGINTAVRATHLTLWCVCLLTSGLLQFVIFSIVRRHHKQIQRQENQLSSNTHSYRRQLKLAVNIAYIVAIYFFFNLPVLIVTTYHQIVGGRLASYNYYSWAETIALFNSSLNPIICCWRSRNIRKAILKFLIVRVTCGTFRTPKDDHITVTGVRYTTQSEGQLQDCTPRELDFECKIYTKQDL